MTTLRTSEAERARTLPGVSVLMLPALLAALLAASPTQAELPDFADLFEENVDSVVHITVVSEGSDMLSRLRQRIPEQWLERRFGPLPRQEPPLRRGQGSGFIISADGYVLTNSHVVSESDDIGDITVRLHDRREFKAELVGSDERADVALLKVDAEDLPAVRLGDSDSLRTGEWVFAIGSPFNFEFSITHGIVSALGRTSTAGNNSYVPFIQSDVAINRGNSGGPLFDLDGRVVGINSQIFSRSGGFQGISLSIPIDAAMEVVEQLRENGKVSRGFLGVTLDSGLSYEVARSLGLDRPRGALVTNVLEDTPAEEAGIQSGDVILSVDGEAVDLSSDLPFMIGRKQSGDTVKLEIWRYKRKLDVEVTLSLLPDADEGQDDEVQDEEELEPGVLGLAVTNVPVEISRRLDIDGGVLVRSSTGLAREADILARDLIIEVQGAPIGDASDFREAVRALEAGEHASFLIMRNGIRTYRAILLPE